MIDKGETREGHRTHEEEQKKEEERIIDMRHNGATKHPGKIH